MLSTRTVILGSAFLFGLCIIVSLWAFGRISRVVRPPGPKPTLIEMLGDRTDPAHRYVVTVAISFAVGFIVWLFAYSPPG